jgi:hypothetical protein
LLFDREIPHKAGVAAMLGQLRHLLSSRKQPISRHTENLAPTTDNSRKGQATSRPPAKAEGFHAATSR